MISRDTPIPNKLSQFWSSEENKVNIQRQVRDIVSHRPSVKPEIMASSIVNDGEMLPAKVSSSEDIPDLMKWIEEDAGFAIYPESAVRMKHCKGTNSLFK